MTTRSKLQLRIEWRGSIVKSTATSYGYIVPERVEKPIKPAVMGFLRWLIWFEYIVALLINDALMTLLAFRVAYLIRFEWTIPVFRLEAMSSQPYYSSLSIILVPIWLMIFAAFGLYRRQNLLGGTEEYALVARGTTIGMLVLIIFGFLEPEFLVARAWLLMAWGLSFIFTAIGRFILRRVIYLLRRRGFFVSLALIVGANDEGISLARQLRNWRTSGLEVIGFVDKKLKPGTVLFEDIRVLGSTSHLDEVIRDYGVEELILASSAISSHDKMLEIFQRYGVDSRVNVRMSSGLYEIITTGLTVREFAYVPLVGINKVRLTGMNRLIKYLFDYSVASLGIIVASPFMLMIAIAIKLDSPGPVIHRRRVMGVNGRQFDAFKFRTMHKNGRDILDQHPELQTELAEKHKIKRDPRVTRVGRVLRRLSLDELPQALNVLKGDMSLVGPRMISPDEIEKYEKWDINLLTVRPGLTGLWQVSGRSDISYKDRVSLDMHYIRNYSIWLDLQILWRTLPAVIQGRGAY